MKCVILFCIYWIGLVAGLPQSGPDDKPLVLNLPKNMPDDPSRWDVRPMGGGQAVGVEASYNAPRWGAKAHVIHDFGSDGTREFKSPIPKEPSNLSGQWIGGGNAVGAVINYETPGWSASGFAVHDFKNQAGRVGAGGSYSAYKPTPNSDISVVGNYSRSYGNACPNLDAYVGMRYTMNF